MKFIKKYWAELLTFGAIFGILLMDLAPGMTWINTDSDGAHYILAAKYMLTAHNTSAPLYLLIGRLFLYLPFGTEAFRMGLISVLSTTICAVLIYQIVKQHLYVYAHSKSRWYALIAAITYGGSVLVISQSTIIETYPFATMLSVLAYYLCLKKKWVWVSIAIGLLWSVHTIFAWSTWLVVFVKYKELRNIPLALLTLSFLAFYAYIPISTAINGDNGMWNNTNIEGFLGGQWGVLWLLTGGISIYDIPKRILDTIALLGVSLGLGFIVTIWYFIKQKTFKSPLLWLFLIPFIYFITNLSPETYVYLLPSIAFGSIVTGIGLSKLNKKVVYVVATVAVCLTGYHAYIMDIGRTLDPNLSAQKYYDEELPKLEDGDIYLGGGWTWAIVYLYNKEEGRNIIPVCTDILPSKDYLDKLESDGIKLTRTDSESLIDRQWAVAKSIAEQNDNVWISKETIPSQYEYELVEAKDNMDLISRWLGYEKEIKVSWLPSNPYKFITGALEIEEWKFIIKSNHNARFLIEWAIFGLGFAYLMERLFRKKKNEVFQTKETDIS